jgi:hypothetical protein
MAQRARFVVAESPVVAASAAPIQTTHRPVPELHALQWVARAGNEGFARWVDVYRQAQAASKGIEVICTFSEVDQVMDTLDPHGLYLLVGGVPSREAGEALLQRVGKWCVGRIY